MAPKDSPRTSLFWAIQPASTTGSAAIVAAAHSLAQYRPSPAMKPTRNTGMVWACTAVRFTAKKKSFQAKITQISAVAAIPGDTSGKMTSRTARQVLAPSRLAASSNSPGTSRKNDRIIHTATGRFIELYRMISAQILSSNPILDTITYSGMIAATMGSILVLMKKNNASWVLRTGRSDNANAAGTPNSSTTIVDTVVANSELSSAVPTPWSNTALNSSRVGTKMIFGVVV